MKKRYGWIDEEVVSRTTPSAPSIDTQKTCERERKGETERLAEEEMRIVLQRDSDTNRYEQMRADSNRPTKRQ